MTKSNFDYVREFLAEISEEPVDTITSQTRLREDLHLDGDEADRLLIGLTDQFGVDLNGFDFYRYFREEPHLFSPVICLWQALRFRRRNPVSITVNHVVEVVRLGQ
ncbi:MAG TPA: DUF1493 family protein [Allocoleopsis sp.]